MRLLEETTDRVAWLTLNRPEVKNALDPDLVSELAGRLEALAEDRNVRVMVLSGAGGAFCSGADLRANVMFEQIGTLIDRYHRLVRAIAAAPQPVIAMVDGPAAGFGCDLALACDLRTMSDRAYLQELFVRIGLMPDGGGSLWLTRAVGLGRALELLFTGERIDAGRALAWGLANRVATAEELRATTAALAATLVKGPPLAYAHIKRAARAANADLDQALEREKRGQLELLQSQDFAEGIGAFIMKREPSFVGK